MSVEEDAEKENACCAVGNSDVRVAAIRARKKRKKNRRKFFVSALHTAYPFSTRNAHVPHCTLCLVLKGKTVQKERKKGREEERKRGRERKRNGDSQ